MVLLKREDSYKQLSLFSVSWKTEQNDGVVLKAEATSGTPRTGCEFIWNSALAGALMGARHRVMLSEVLTCIFSFLNNVGNLNYQHQNKTLYLHALKAKFLLNLCQVLNKREKQKWNQHLLSLPIVCSPRVILHSMRNVPKNSLISGLPPPLAAI